jgi:hypothetical protein
MANRRPARAAKESKTSLQKFNDEVESFASLAKDSLPIRREQVDGLALGLLAVARHVDEENSMPLDEVERYATFVSNQVGREVCNTQRKIGSIAHHKKVAEMLVMDNIRYADRYAREQEVIVKGLIERVRELEHLLTQVLVDPIARPRVPYTYSHRTGRYEVPGQ